MKRGIRGTALLAAALLLGMFSGCGQPPPFPKTPLASHEGTLGQGEGSLPPANEDGFIVVEIPTSLLAGHTAEELEEEDRASRQGLTHDELEQALWSALLANGDGTFSYYFTPEQYERTKDYYYEAGRLRKYSSGGFSAEFVRQAEYTQWDEDGIPTALLVKVDKEEYLSFELMNVGLATVLPSVCLGRYQILCGVPPEECMVLVRVVDEKTGELIVETTFPVEEGLSSKEN